MEQIVLGIFQDQLSKVIVDFRKEQVNANLLNGKGEITDISLNCAVINKQISRVTPFVEFDDIHVSRLGFHVTSWTNIRQAPIVVDIGTITARVNEPLQCLPRHQRKRVQMLSKSELEKLIKDGFKPLRGNGSYGLADRIVDNMTIEMECLRLDVQTLGRFKTKRRGPWTPPLLQIEYNNLKVVMVDVDGNEASPDKVWAHNRGKRQQFMIYKKICGECVVRLILDGQGGKDTTKATNNKGNVGSDDISGENISNKKHESSSPQKIELAKMKMEVQTAVRRRLKDGAVLAVQMDTTIPKVEFQLDSESVHQLAHVAVGMQFCFAKDRSFEDPLKPISYADDHHHTPHAPTIKMLSRGASIDTVSDVDNDTDVNDGKSSATSFDLSPVDGDESTADDAASTASGSMIDMASVASSDDDNFMGDDVASSRDGSSHGMLGSSSRPRRVERPVILLPNGLVIYNSISITCNIHEFAFRGYYPETNDSFVEFEARGCVTEAFWPKTDNEHGLYAQMSTAYVALQERYGMRTRTLLLGGMHRDDHMSRQLPSNAPKTIGADEFFPLFERPWIRVDPIDLRHLFPAQAFGVKTTISLKRADDNTDEDDKYMVLHEMGVDGMDMVLDTDSIQRMSEFFLGKNGKPLDPRWQTGDWTDAITQNMLRKPSETLVLDDYLQHPKLILLDDNFMPSSDLFNVTAKLTNVEMKIPAAIQDSLRSCDLTMKWKETTIVVSSLLPRTFLSGKLCSSISGDARSEDEKGIIDFPNDPSDICYNLEDADSTPRSDGVAMSTFRFQFTTSGFEMGITPIIPFCKAVEPRQLISLSNSTVIFCFEGRPPESKSKEVTITIFLSILVHQLVVNIDLELLVGALVTVLHHGNNIHALAKTANELYPPSPKPSSVESTFDFQGEVESSPLLQSMKGRKIMVQRRLSQSRETGGLSIVVCMQQNDFHIRFWRQNVPSNGPLRSKMSINSNDCLQAYGDRLIHALKVCEFEMKGFETGIEFDFHGNDNYRTVVKSFLEKAHLQLCGLEKDLDALDHSEEDKIDQNMLDIIFFGMGCLPGSIEVCGNSQQFALRMEGRHKKEAQSWSIAADVTSPSLICLHAEAMRNAAIQILEALLLPSYSPQAHRRKHCPFPPGTIGALMFEYTELHFGERKHVELSNLDISNDTNEPIVERFLRSVCKLVLPSAVDVILLHCEVGNLFLSIPDDNNSNEANKELSLLLHQAEIVSRFYPVKGTPTCGIEHVLACKGTDWSTLINTPTDGLYLRFSARQSLLVRSMNTAEKVVQPFEVSLIYAAGKVSISMNEDFLIDDIRLIEKFQSRLRNAVWASADSLSQVAMVVSAMKDRSSARIPIDSTDSPVEQNESSFVDAFSDLSQDHSQHLRELLQLAEKEVRMYNRETQLAIIQRDDDLEASKIALFVKERERMGFLSLLSSQVAGWIRVGGRHRTGQRIAKKTLVWPHYAVLRNELIILYSSPSSNKPSDVVSLRNTTIRLLAGGRSKQDVKRAFALVERSGMTRYFVAQTAQEFNLWTREIVSAIRMHSDTDFQLCVEEDAGKSENDSRLSFGEINDDSQNDEGDEDKRRIGNRLASAYQSVRLKGKEISERRRMKSSDIGADESEGLGTLNERKLSTGDIIGEETRRAQIGKKLSGVGEVTKNRLGSALQSARQKGAELSSRRSRNEGSLEESDRGDGLDEVDASIPPRRPDGGIGRRQLGVKLGSAIQNVRMKAAGTPEKVGRLSGLRGKLGGLAQGRGDDTSDRSTLRTTESSIRSTDGDEDTVSWTCDTCTFMNTQKQEFCEMCGTERKPQHYDFATEAPCGQMETGETSGNSDAVDETFSAPSTTDIVPGDNENNRNSIRLSLRNRAEIPTDDRIFGGGNLALRNVLVADLAPPAVKELLEKVEIPLKKLERQWTVTVRSQERCETTSPCRLSETTDVKIGDRDFESSTGDGSDSGGATQAPEDVPPSIDSLRGDSDLAASVIEDSALGVTSQDAGAETTKRALQLSFMVRVYDTGTIHKGDVPASEKIWSLGDVLLLHSQISESMESVLPQLIPNRSYEESEASLIDIKTQNSRSLLAEKVLVSGRILRGLLSQGENQSTNDDGFHQYQSEVIEYFINAVLECPMPIDALATISEALGIASSTQDAPAEAPFATGARSTGSNKSNSLEDLSTRVSKILSLLSASQIELQRMELCQPAEALARTQSGKRASFTEPSNNTYHDVRSVLVEPLIPPSLTSSIHTSMHEALMNVMCERDEAHAKLIGENVLSTHKVERERKKNERMEYDTNLRREIARIQLEQDLQHPNLGNLFGNQDDKMAKLRQEIDKKIESFRRMINTNGDDEMMQLCAQLSAEISAKTSLALEIERLKSIREAEKKIEATERKAVEDELKRVKHLLAMEQKKNESFREQQQHRTH
jgi:N-terminal region of Chorein or VPS13/PH domain